MLVWDTSHVHIVNQVYEYIAASDDESLWTIPISIAFPTEPNPGWEDTTAQVWLTKKVQNFTPDHTPYILNVQEAGYYRVNYAQDNWNSLSKLLNSDDFTKIHQLNRAQLIDDSLNLARSDKIDYKTALGLTRYLNKEDDYIPWQAASKGLSYLFTRFECQNCANAEDQERLNTFIIDILDHHYKDLGFNPPSDNDDHIRILSRSSASSWMCRMNYPDCIDKAKSQFKSWKESKTEIKADLKDNVYRTAIRMGGQAEWDFMYEQFKIVEIDSERQKYIYALGASEDPIILEKYLNMTLDRETSGIRLQDVIYIYRTISSSKIGRDVAMNWIENYYDFIDMAYGSATGVIGGGSFSKYVATIIAGYAGTANVQADIHRINAFIEEHTADLQGVSSSLTDSIKQALINVAWIENHYAQVVDWLKGTYPDDPPSAASMLNSNFMSVSSIIVILYSIFGQ
jgi:aminopeptidase N